MKRVLLVLTSVVLVSGCTRDSHRSAALSEYGYNFDLVVPSPPAATARLGSLVYVSSPVLLEQSPTYTSVGTPAATSDGITATDPSITLSSPAPASSVVVEGSGISPANTGVTENTSPTSVNPGVNGIGGTTPILVDGTANGLTGTTLASNSTNGLANPNGSTMSATNNLGISAVDTNKSIAVSFAKAPTNAIVQEASGAQRVGVTNANASISNNGNRFLTNQTPNTVQQQPGAGVIPANGQQNGAPQNGSQPFPGQTNNGSVLQYPPIQGTAPQQSVNGGGNQNQVTPGGQTTPAGQANSGSANTSPTLQNPQNPQNAQGRPAPVPSTGTSTGTPQNRPAPTPAAGTTPIGSTPANQH